MTTPKRNQAVAPCAWIVSNGSQCCEPWVVFEKSEVDAMPSACIAGAVYSQQTIDALQGEVSRLRELVTSARRAMGDHNAPNDCYATGPMTGDPYRDLVECPACSFLAMLTNLEPPTDGR